MGDYNSRNGNSSRGGGSRNEGPRRGGDSRQGGNRQSANRQGGSRSDRPRRHEEGGEGRREARGGARKHAQRGGGGRNQGKFQAGPNRPGFREERIVARQNEPDLPSDIDVKDLDRTVLQDLRSLAKDNADAVAKHMIMAATLMADDPQLALRHARAAKDRGGRVSVVRETAGIAAYHAGEWKEALSELRASRRMSGGPGLVAVMADCERALGRPEKAIELSREVSQEELDDETRIELAIVVAGARHDLGQHDAAVVELSKVGPRADAEGVSASRLMYAYADALLAVGRKDEAKEWFGNAQRADVDCFLDTEDRLKELS